MNQQQFYLSLAATCLLAIILQLGLQQFLPPFQSHASVTWWSLGLFIPFSLLMYFMAKPAAASDNKKLFTQLSMAFTFMKMMLAVFALVIYKKVFQPDSKHFIFPFFAVYLIFTVFETYFMIKLAKK